QFGLGEQTGIGLQPESKGLLPSAFRGPANERASTAWYASIGQGTIAATPIQLGNYVATIARGGIRMRPKLLKTPVPTTQPSTVPDMVDLHLPRDAVNALHEGMKNVVA